MRLRRFGLGSLFALSVLVSVAGAQAAPRPQPYFIRGVQLDRAGERKGCLHLRDGAIVAVLDEAAPTPSGVRVIDGTGLLCLPAFLDAYSRQGCTVPQPVKDQDLPPSELSDVGIDMRLANRKGIQPAFRAVEALLPEKELGEPWRKSGFGAVLVAPGGELLSGSSALVTTREAATRDRVARDEVFFHGAFTANGPGYPSTLMGYFAQLRQFFLDSQRQVELARRYAAGRPGTRPPFDAELAAGVTLLGRERRLLCEANSAADIERWLRLADEFRLEVDFAGGLEAWRVREELARRGATVALSLDWGKEVKDPRPKEDAKPEAKTEAKTESTSGEGAPQSQEAAAAKPAEAEAAPAASPAEPEVAPEYVEPYAVRLERRLKWEEARDCALRLAEAEVRFTFGTALARPSELLEKVRTLVASGLSADDALDALTRSAAGFLGVSDRLGQIAPGFDATFTLWRKDPLIDKEASAAWVFVDGFPSEFKEVKKKARKGGGPGEGIDPTGSWKLEFAVQGEGIKSAELVLEMQKDGTVTGTLEVENPMGGAKIKTDVEGQVSGDELEFDCTLDFGEFKIESTLTAKIEGDTLSGESSFHGPWSSEPTQQSFTGKRGPK